jgi:hypothetical protein
MIAGVTVATEAPPPIMDPSSYFQCNEFAEVLLVPTSRDASDSDIVVGQRTDNRSDVIAMAGAEVPRIQH